MKSSPQHGLQNTAIFHLTSVGTKAVPAPGHCWTHGSGKGGDGGRLPCHGRLLELLGMTRAVKCTPLQSLFFSSMSCMHEIKSFLVQSFSTSSCSYTKKSTFQPIVSKNRVCEKWQLLLDIDWEFKELSAFPHIGVSSVFLAWRETIVSGSLGWRWSRLWSS